jgi:Holliday junction DNA helicase RuvB
MLFSISSGEVKTDTLDGKQLLGTSTNMSNDNPKDLREIQPTSFRHIIGQNHVKKALQIAVDASFQEGKRLDETLLCGPPGLGKTALVSVLASELAVPFKEILAQSITNTAELNGTLLEASEGILFLDEIALLHPVVQHSLLMVLDRRRISLNTGKTVQTIPVSNFTLIGATTDPDGLIGPLIDRFRIVLHLDYYSHPELAQVVRQRCLAMDWQYEPELPDEIAHRGHQTPRIAIRLLQSARRVAMAEGAKLITVAHLRLACEIERISDLGLDNLQQKFLRLLDRSGQRLNVLASQLGVGTKVVSKTVEPYLLRSGLIAKTDGGLRQLTESGRKHLASLTATETILKQP